ncbi:hypothetical protein PRZ48_014847 [Zasmidium cellare]|uniref:SnoaL-like domain-containing protein n=1 Tax=Zasmidium cellare TaxID=395010 RepID=A0ABR0DWW1_ZASCE|nr:hypothetical protein PRZ48_014847 [Zasmidium cellare]
MRRPDEISGWESPNCQCLKDQKPAFSKDASEPLDTTDDDQTPSSDNSAQTPQSIPLGNYDVDEVAARLITVCDAFYDAMKQQDWERYHQLGTKFWHDKVNCSFNDQDFDSGVDTSYTQQLQTHSELSDSEIIETKADVKETSGYATVFQWVKVGLGPHKMQTTLLNVIRWRKLRGDWKVYKVDSIKAENMF